MDGKITFDFSDKLYSVWWRRAGMCFGRADRSTIAVSGNKRPDQAVLFELNVVRGDQKIGRR
jgi:hypothetical protein